MLDSMYRIDWVRCSRSRRSSKKSSTTSVFTVLSSIELRSNYFCTGSIVMLGAYETDVSSHVGDLVALIGHALILSVLIEVHVVIRYEESPFPCHLLDFTPYGFGIRVKCKTDSVINNR